MLNMITSFVSAFAIPVVSGTAGASYLKQYIPEWNARGFTPMQSMWKPLWIWATVLAAALGTLAYFASGNNPVVAAIMATFVVFSTVVNFSDGTVRKVPSQVSNMMCLAGAVLMTSLILAGERTHVDAALFAQPLFIRIPTDVVVPILLSGIAAVLIGFLGFVKIGSLLIAKMFLLLGQAGMFTALYAPLSWAAISVDSPLNEYWKSAAAATILPLTVLAVVWCFSWMVGDAIGGADIMYMYFVGMTLPFLIGPTATLWGILISMPIQLVAHMLAPLFKWGEFRPVRNGPIAQWFENRKAKREGREPSRSKLSRGIAYLPILTVTMMVVTVSSFV